MTHCKMGTVTVDAINSIIILAKVFDGIDRRKITNILSKLVT